jgi:hypothetical protein
MPACGTFLPRYGAGLSRLADGRHILLVSGAFKGRGEEDDMRVVQSRSRQVSGSWRPRPVGRGRSPES